MVTTGTTFRCQSCQTEVEIVSGEAFGGPLVCCELEMKQVGDEYEQLYEKEAYDPSDFEWD